MRTSNGRLAPRLVAALLGLLLADSRVDADTLYSVTPLSTRGIAGVNNSGQYVVNAFGGGYLYNEYGPGAGRPTFLGTLANGSSQANAINDSGQIVGGSQTASGASHAFLDSNGKMTDLGTLGGPSSVADAINNSGQVVGTSDVAGGQSPHLFLYDHGQMTDLGAGPGSLLSVAGLNNSGQIAFTSVSGQPQPYLDSHGRMIDLGGLNPSNPAGFAMGINASGQVVGLSYNAQEQRHAFLYSNGALHDLGTLGGTVSQANGINDKGQVVGESLLANGATEHAFLYENGKMLDLNNFLPPAFAGTTLFNALSLNNLGQIVAEGITSGPHPTEEQFLLTPPCRPTPAPPVPLPEPSPLALPTLLAIAFAVRRWLLRPGR